MGNSGGGFGRGGGDGGRGDCAGGGGRSSDDGSGDGTRRGSSKGVGAAEEKWAAADEADECAGLVGAVKDVGGEDCVCVRLIFGVGWVTGKEAVIEVEIEGGGHLGGG